MKSYEHSNELESFHNFTIEFIFWVNYSFFNEKIGEVSFLLQYIRAIRKPILASNSVSRFFFLILFYIIFKEEPFILDFLRLIQYSLLTHKWSRSLLNFLMYGLRCPWILSSYMAVQFINQEKEKVQNETMWKERWIHLFILLKILIYQKTIFWIWSTLFKNRLVHTTQKKWNLLAARWRKTMFKNTKYSDIFKSTDYSTYFRKYFRLENEHEPRVLPIYHLQ